MKYKNIYFSIIGLMLLIAIGFIAIFSYIRFVYPLNYVTEIDTYSKRYNMDAALVASVINAESRFNKNAVSKKGAIGLMQIMPKTGEWVAEKLGKENYQEIDLYNPEVNIEIGIYYLNYLFSKFSDQTAVLAAYNAGEGIVKNWLNGEEYSTDKISLQKIPYIETDIYIKKIERNYKYYSKKLK